MVEETGSLEEENIKVLIRDQDQKVYDEAKQSGLTDLQARITAGRAGGGTVEDWTSLIFPSLNNLSHPEHLQDSAVAVKRLAEAIINREKIGIITDYDVDGLSSHAVLYEAFKRCGMPSEQLASFIGNRLRDGYGLSESLAGSILNSSSRPDLVITADCGISDNDRIEALTANGIDVIITDHHLIPPAGLPEAALAVVNPVRRDCTYPDKQISGCMVAWLLTCLLRKYLIDQETLAADTPRFGDMLDLVGLSVISDSISLKSQTSRAVVKQGLIVLNKLKRPAWMAMARHLGRGSNAPFITEDLAFQIAPRINACGRVSDPFAGLYFLVAKNDRDAEYWLDRLNRSNLARKGIEKEIAIEARQKGDLQIKEGRRAIVAYGGNFHAGVQGIVASRMVDYFHRPALIFSPLPDNLEELSGSARTIEGIDIHSVLKAIDRDYDDLLIAFGGHKKAAGLKIHKNKLEKFSSVLEDILSSREYSDSDLFHQKIYTDGFLDPSLITRQTLKDLAQLEPFGNDFPEALFLGDFKVNKMKFIGKDEAVHLSMTLEVGGKKFPAILFNAIDSEGEDVGFNSGETISCIYKLKFNFYNGRTGVQLHIDNVL
ncbi:MAG: single-stranded-DNA-specific exonuclease RecJ [Desulfurivibrionaceae bacterium]